MNTLRHQRYTNLLDQILYCRQGEERSILRRNSDLVDSGFIAVLNQHVNHTYCINDEKSHKRLLNLLMQFKEVEENNYLVNFLEEILQSIYNGSDTNKNYLLLKNNEYRVNTRLLDILSDRLNSWLRTNDVSQEIKLAAINSLGNLFTHWPLGHCEINLELAIKAYQVIVDYYSVFNSPINLEQWAATQNNMATAYVNRIEGDKSDNFCHAIESCHKALSVYGDDNCEQRAMTYNNLANVYLNYAKWKSKDSKQYIDHAITECKKALNIISRDKSPDKWAVINNTLGIIYSSENARNDEKAVFHFCQALSVWNCKSFKEEWAAVQNNLGIIYSNQSDEGIKDSFEKSKKCFESCLQVYTPDLPRDWAMVQAGLGILHHNSSLFDEAIQFYNSALKIYTPTQLPKSCCRISHLLASLQSDCRNWMAAVDAYETAIAAAKKLYQSCILLDTKSVELHEISELSRHSTYAHAKIGNLQRAIETLEQGRARGLTESLDRDRSDLTKLQQINSKLYDRYKDTTNQIRNLEAQQRDRMTSTDRHSITPEVLRETATNLRQQLNNLIQEIRQVPGYEAFLTLPIFEDIRKAAKSDRPLIYLVTTSAGSLALILTPEDIQPLWLNDLNEQQLREIVQTWFAAYNQSQTDPQTWLNTIDTTTRQLWEPLMAPIIEKLNLMGHDRATLIPTGYLSLLPLHAAWTEDSTKPRGRRYAIDDIHFTYAPNAKSLIAAQKIAKHTEFKTILAIDNPTQDPKLSSSEKEINTAIGTFQNCNVLLRHSGATVKAVKDELTKAAIVHFSCHGTANLNDPLNSGLVMSDGNLTLKDIFALNLTEGNQGIRLAILSACETGMIGIENADEAVSLPTGLLQAGVAAVIASLWSVDELSTMILLTKFYDLWRKGEEEPAIALHKAQQWMYQTTDGEKADYCKSNNLKLNIRQCERNLYTYAHPFHWSAFTYLGV